MNRENNLIDCLFSLVDSLNTVVDRLGILTDRLEGLVQKNDEVFSKMREEFFRKIIEHEVNNEMQKNQQSKDRRTKFGSDIVREAKSS